MSINKFKASFVLICLSLQACSGGDMADLKRFVDTAFEDEKPKIEPLPEIRPFQKFEYIAKEESDPFSRTNVISNRDEDSVAVDRRPDATRIKEPLEDFPLDALRMVGTMSQNGVPWVIVKTTQGTAYLASLGNYMGLNDGKVSQIFPEEQKIILQETVADPSGRWVTREVEITIDE
jgi:type IV pilus assembly protein PilP